MEQHLLLVSLLLDPITHTLVTGWPLFWN